MQERLEVLGNLTIFENMPFYRPLLRDFKAAPRSFPDIFNEEDIAGYLEDLMDDVPKVEQAAKKVKRGL